MFKSQSKAVVQSPVFEMKLKPAGVLSDTRAFFASLGPAFVTLMLNTAFSPGTMLEGVVFNIAKSALETILVGSLAPELLGLSSPPPATLAVLMTLAPMFCETLTLI
jgi:hypothetical protein